MAMDTAPQQNNRLVAFRRSAAREKPRMSAVGDPEAAQHSSASDGGRWTKRQRGGSVYAVRLPGFTPRQDGGPIVVAMEDIDPVTGYMRPRYREGGSGRNPFEFGAPPEAYPYISAEEAAAARARLFPQGLAGPTYTPEPAPVPRSAPAYTAP